MVGVHFVFIVSVMEANGPEIMEMAWQLWSHAFFCFDVIPDLSLHLISMPWLVYSC